MQEITEQDWKIFKTVRERALERFTQRVLDECHEICNNQSMNPYDRYIKLKHLFKNRDKELAQTFDSFSRSKARIALRNMRTFDLLTEDEIGQFSEDTQRIING